MIESFFLYFNQVSVSCLVITFFVIWVHKKRIGNVDLETVIGTSLAAATFPTSIALVICAFDKNHVTKLQDLSLNLAIAGVVLLFVAWRTIEKDW